MLKPDIWLGAHNDDYGFERKLARSAEEGARAWVDPEGYRKWVVAQRARLDAAIDREVRAANGPAELLHPSEQNRK
jgi:metallo-beta-lactamase class B